MNNSIVKKTLKRTVSCIAKRRPLCRHLLTLLSILLLIYLVVKHLPVASTRIVWSDVTHFKRRLLDREISLAMSTIQEFDTLLRNHSLPYFICAGTLIGSYRHHGFIPWDDDFDVYVAKEKKDLLKTLQQTLNDTGFVLDDSQGSRWKIYHTSGAPIRGQWRFPFLV